MAGVQREGVPTGLGWQAPRTSVPAGHGRGALSWEELAQAGFEA